MNHQDRDCLICLYKAVFLIPSIVPYLVPWQLFVNIDPTSRAGIGMDRRDQRGTRYEVWCTVDAPYRAADRWRLCRTGRFISAGLPWIKCGVLSHIVTYASVVHAHHLPLFLSLSLTSFVIFILLLPELYIYEIRMMSKKFIKMEKA